MATVVENIETATDKAPVQIVHIIDHTAHQHEGDCKYAGKWTWHTQNGGHIDTTTPNGGSEHEGATVYPIKGASVPAFAWGFSCVPDEVTRYRHSLR
jgi:hypothetical protein